MTILQAERVRTNIASIVNIYVVHAPPSSARDTLIASLDSISKIVDETEDGRPWAGRTESIRELARDKRRGSRV